MKPVRTVLIIFMVIFLVTCVGYLDHLAKKQAKKEQCEQKVQFYAMGGKLYPCKGGY